MRICAITEYLCIRFCSSSAAMKLLFSSSVIYLVSMVDLFLTLYLDTSVFTKSTRHPLFFLQLNFLFLKLRQLNVTVTPIYIYIYIVALLI